MIFMIAIVKHRVKSSNKETVKAIRVFGTDAMNSRDIEIKQFIKCLMGGISVENVRLENKDIKMEGFDIKKLPVVYDTSDVSDKNTSNSTIFHIGYGEYIAIDRHGVYTKHNNEYIKNIILTNNVVNPDYYIPQADEVNNKQKIIKSLTEAGCKDVLVNDLCELVSVYTPDSIDLVLLNEIYNVREGAIKSDTGKYNSITLGSEGDELGSNIRLCYTFGFSTSIKTRINKLVINSSRDIGQILDLERVGHTDLVINFDTNKDSSIFISRLSRYSTKRLSDIVLDGSVTVHIRPEHRLKVDKIQNLTKELRRLFSLEKKIRYIEDVKTRIGIDGYKSIAQVKSKRFVDALKNIFDPELYREVISYIDEFDWDIQEVIKNNSVIKFPKYNGVCINIAKVTVQCSNVKLPKRKNKSDADDILVSYVNSSSFEKKNTTYNNLHADINIADLGVGFNYLLLGINTTITNELRYCALKLTKTTLGRTSFGGIENLTLEEVVSLLENKPGMQFGEILRIGNYIVIKSLADLSIFDYSIVSNEIEEGKSSSLKRLEAISGLIGNENGRHITAQGYMTSIDNEERELIIPPAVKMVMPRVLRRDYYEVLDVPAGMTPLNRKNFNAKRVSIYNLIVRDRVNAYSALKLNERPLDEYGYQDLTVNTIYYTVTKQEDLYRFLTNAWNKGSFHLGYNLIAYSARLDVDYTAKLLSYMIEKSKYYELDEADEQGDYATLRNLQMKYRKELLYLKKSIYVMEDALDDGVLRAVKKGMKLHLVV